MQYVSWRPDLNAMATECSTPSMEQVDRLCIPTILSDWGMPQEDQEVQGISGPGGSCMEIPAVVPPVLLELLIDYPLILPTDSDLLVDPANSPHPLPNCWLQNGAMAQTEHIRVLGRRGIAGVQNKRVVCSIDQYHPVCYINDS